MREYQIYVNGTHIASLARRSPIGSSIEIRDATQLMRDTRYLWECTPQGDETMRGFRTENSFCRVVQA